MEQIIGPMTKLGRYLLAVPFAIFGIFHFLGADKMAGMVPIPGGIVWVYLSGMGLIAAAIAIIMNRKSRLAATLVAILLLVFICAIHLPSVIGGGDSGQTSLMNLLKDTALAGGALIYAGTQPID